MPPLSLNDDELDTLMALAAPLPIENRAAFIEAIAAELAGAEVPGAVHRVARRLQRKFFNQPPIRAAYFSMP